MRYVYIQSEPGLWTAGFYDPSGKWQPESDHTSDRDAAERVHYLNGGDPATGDSKELVAAILRLREAFFVKGTKKALQAAFEGTKELVSKSLA